MDRLQAPAAQVARATAVEGARNLDALAILQRLGRGSVIHELTDALTRTAEEAVETGKPGTVTLTLKVSTKAIGDRFITVEEQVARTSPKRDPRGTFFWVVDGELFKDDPHQAAMPLRSIDLDTGEIREGAGAPAHVREVVP